MSFRCSFSAVSMLLTSPSESSAFREPRLVPVPLLDPTALGLVGLMSFLAYAKGVSRAACAATARAPSDQQGQVAIS